MANILINILGDASKLKGELDKSSKNVTSFSEKIGKIGKIATVAGTAVTAAFTAIVLKTAAVGDQFDKMSLRTGVAVEDLSALAYAADISGTDIGTLEKGLKGLTKVMDDASMGIGEGMEAFELLNIAVVDSEGKLRSTVDVLKEAATKISAIEDPTKQAALAMDLFGARAGPQLLPLLKVGEAGIEDLMNRAKELGITMSTEAAVKAAEFTDRMTDLKGSLAGAGRTIGDTLIPAIIPMIEKVTEIVGKVVAWTKENPELVATITKVAAIVGVAAAVGGPILMLVAAFSAVAPAIALIGTIATGPIGLLIIAVTAIIAVWKNWDKIVEFVTEWKDKIIGFLTDLKDTAITKVTDMIDWIIEKFEDIAELPAKALQWGKDIITDFVKGIVDLIDRLLGGAIKKVIDEFKDIVDLPKKALEWGKNAITGFTDGIKDKMSDITDAVKGVGNKIKDFLGFESPPKEGPLSGSDKWMPNMMIMMAAGITTNIPKVETAVDELTTAVEDKMVTMRTNIGENTEEMMDDIEGAIEDGTPGIVTKTETLADKILGIFEGLEIDMMTPINNIIDSIQTDLGDAIGSILKGEATISEAWNTFWTGLYNTVLTQVGNIIAEIIYAAAVQFLLALGPIGWVILLAGAAAIWAWINAQSKAIGGEIEAIASSVKKFQMGGGTDTALAWFTPGEYVVSKPMTDFIKKFKMIPSNLIDAIAGGLPTPTPAYAGGGLIESPSINSSGFGGATIYVDIHDNRISDDVDIKKLSTKVSDEILRKLNLNRRH